MPVITDCPSCHRKVRIPDELIGQTVRCPTCGATFTGAAQTPIPIPPLPPLDVGLAPENEYEERPVSPEPKLVEEPAYHEDLPRAPRERRPEARLLRREGSFQPHRGTLILVLGILSLVICGFLGPVAWIMGSNDLKAIRAGRMDPEGEGTTQAGRICGIIATTLLVFYFCCGGALLLGRMGAARHF